MALSLTNSLKRHWQDDEGNHKWKLSRLSYKKDIQKTSFTESCDSYRPNGYSDLANPANTTDSSELCERSPHKNTQLSQSVDKQTVHFMDMSLHKNTFNKLVSASSLQEVIALNKNSLPRCPECASGKSGHIQHMKHWQTMDYL